MNEFLKNFRTSHSRYAANKKPPYDGHYYSTQDRRNGNDRRNDPQGLSSAKASQSLFVKLEEFLPSIQALVDSVNENHQHVIDLNERMTQSIETMAAAFKEIAATLKQNPTTEAIPVHISDAEKNVNAPALTIEDLEKAEMKSSADEKREIIKIMKKLRKKGGTYKEIANFLNENKIPTFSDKGHWHAQTIHRLCSR